MYKKYNGESKAPAMGPKIGSVVKRPVGGSGMPKFLSLHKRGGQPMDPMREKHGWGGAAGDWLKGAANKVGDAVTKSAPVRLAQTAGKAIVNSPGGQQIKGVIDGFEKGGCVGGAKSNVKRGRITAKDGGWMDINNLAKRVAKIEKHMRGGTVGRGK